MRHAKTEVLWIGAAIAVGALLRAYGVGFGLPFLSNFYIRPDESLIVQVGVLLFERKGDPQFFAYPALMAEVCALIYGAMKRFVGDFAANPSAYFLAARWVSVIAGTATIAVVWRTARMLCGWGWAVGAAALYAVCPLAVRDAHFGVTDTLVTLLVSLGMLLAVRYAQQPNETKPLWGPAAWMGLAISTKYTAALTAPMLAAAVVEREGWHAGRALRLLIPAAAMVATIFVLLNPYVLLRIGETIDVVLGMFGVFYQGKSAQAATTWNLNHGLGQVSRPLSYGPGGWIGLLLALLSLRWVAGKHAVKGVFTVACATFPLLLALLPFLHPLPLRYVLPALPGITVLAAFAVSRLARYRYELWLASALGAGMLLWQLGTSVSLVTVLAREDTRSLAGAWIERELPREIPVVLLGPPEAEPQIAESAASIDRRIRYVHRIYGPQSGEVVSELYRLQLRAAGGGREVYRNPDPKEVKGRRIAVVAPAYPLPMIGAVPEDAALPFGTVQSAEDFDPIVGDMEQARLDRIDAWLLPMNPRWLVERPGPRLRVMVVDRDESLEP